MARLVLPLVLLALSSACATVDPQVAAAAKNVRTVKEAADSCREIGPVRGEDMRLNTNNASHKFEGTREGAYEALKLQAAMVGADTVRIDQEGPDEEYSNTGTKLGYVIHGVAFQCVAPASAEAAAP